MSAVDHPGAGAPRRTTAWLRGARLGLTAVALALHSTAAAAQRPLSRDVGVTATFGVNVLLGGVTAATRALIEGHDPARAFAIGALGGAVHFGAKVVGPGTSLAGMALGATGTSLVVNAGRGVSPLDELYVPVGPLRVRISPRAARKVRVAVHVYDAVVLAHNLGRSGLVVDWGRTASSGAFVLRADGRRIWSDDHGEVGGLALGSLVVMSGFAVDPARVTKHELVHVHQYLFLDEAVGRPLEDYLRRRVPIARRLPRWLELGVVVPALGTLDRSIFGAHGPVYRLGQSEAEILEQCC